jgi:HEAT repeat protein
MLWWTLRRLQSRVTSPDYRERLSAVQSLAGLPDRRGVEFLRRALNDADPDVTQAAIAGLTTLGASGAAPDVVPLLLDDREDVRRSAREALHALDPAWTATAAARDLIPLLAERSIGADEGKRRWALDLLDRIDVGWKTGAQTAQAARQVVPFLTDLPPSALG